MILVTGGAGFIGSNFVRSWVVDCDEPVINVDLLTYAGNLENLAAVRRNARHELVRMDICDGTALRALLTARRPRAIVHLAAETHVDRSIHGPAAFIRTNVVGTHTLLDAAKEYWTGLDDAARRAFRFLHVSTDEVYGSLALDAAPCNEQARYAPNSPYAASKAASDHLVRAYHATFGLPVLVTNCSNNYGPYQHPEKLIPLVITNALAGEAIPVYGDGQNVRDWLHVEDHCDALRTVLAHGLPGETYNVSAHSERTNLLVVHALCDVVDALVGAGTSRRRELVRMVKDRPGHDRRYALDASKLQRELGWVPAHEFTAGMGDTVRWYVEHAAWVKGMRNDDFKAWVDSNYREREPS